MSMPSHYIKAQVVRILGLSSYYKLAPILRRAKVTGERIHGTVMIPHTLLAELRKAKKEIEKERK